jgi:hypothetical protein
MVKKIPAGPSLLKGRLKYLDIICEDVCWVLSLKSGLLIVLLNFGKPPF